MPTAVIKVSIEIPNSAFTPQIKCRFPILIYDDDPVRWYLIVRDLLYVVDVVLIVGYDIILDLENSLAIGVCKISV